jgi:cell division protein FtsQ
MRQVKVERKARGNPRSGGARGTARPKRQAARPPFGRRAPSGGAIARLLAPLWAPFARFASRPMLTLCGALFLLVLLAALFASGVIGRTAGRVNAGIAAVTADAGFGISEIHISGNRRTPYRTVLAVLGMQPGQSIFSADLVGAQRRLASLDWIASAEVHRRYPDAIFVTLVEKRPFALWRMPAGADGAARVAVVERSGGVITTRGVEKFSRLPKLAGAGAPRTAADLVDAVAAHRAVAARTAFYVRVSERRWNLVLKDGVVVKLPETGWQKQIGALEHLIVDAGILERNVAEIDLRAPTHFFFTLRGGEKKDVVRGKET